MSTSEPMNKGVNSVKRHFDAILMIYLLVVSQSLVTDPTDHQPGFDHS